MFGSNQVDMKFTYCAVSISYILDDWSGIDIEKLEQYIRESLVSKKDDLVIVLEGVDCFNGKSEPIPPSNSQSFCS